MMGRKPGAAHDRPAVKVECTHHWIIESPGGPTSRGVCKFCGARDAFSNYVRFGVSEGKSHAS